MLLFYCDRKYSPSDGQGVTWYEPTPVNTSDPTEFVPPVIVQVCVESSVSLNWSYSLTSDLSLGVIKFNGVGIVRIKADSSADPVKAQFQERFTVSSTPGRVSLSISPVTVDDDGEFSCELIDSSPDTWKRAIQVQVMGKLKSVAYFRKGVP